MARDPISAEGTALNVMLRKIGVAYRSRSVAFLIENPPKNPTTRQTTMQNLPRTYIPTLWLTVHKAFF